MKNLLMFLLASIFFFPGGPQKKVRHNFWERDKVDSVIGSYRISYEYQPNMEELVYKPYVEESTGDTVHYYDVGTRIPLCLQKNGRTYLQKTFGMEDFASFLEAEEMTRYQINGISIEKVKEDSVFLLLVMCMPDTDICYEFRIGVGDDGGINIKEAYIEYELMGYLDRYDMLVGVFESLSMETFPLFIKERGMCVDDRLSRYWGRYGQIENVDTLFGVLVSCDFSPEVNVEELSLYVYVMGEALGNKRLDGYVREFVCSRYGDLHMYHPACLFQYLRFADQEKRETILNFLCREMYDLSEEAVDVLLERHKKNLSQYAPEIEELKRAYDSFVP